jgi:citrate lyase beta subunit
MLTIEHPEAMYPNLYSPATMEPKRLLSYMQGDVDYVRRFSICTEDAVAEVALKGALGNLQEALQQYEPTEQTDVFVRLRNPDVRDKVLAMEGVDKLKGFVIPKAEPDTYPEWAACIGDRSPEFRIMPLLESKGIHDPARRKDLRDVLADPQHRSRIDCLRIGANDLMNNLGVHRPDPPRILYDNRVIGGLISDIVNEFAGVEGFQVTAPLFEHFKFDGPDGEFIKDTFEEEVATHIDHGLFGQVVIHPNQLPTLWEMYKVTDRELKHAQRVVAEKEKAAAADNGQLLSTQTHAKWAGQVLQRAAMFGTR